MTASDALRVALIGIGATAVMDGWLLLLKALGVPTLNLAFIGRWVGHWRHGQWRHAAIAKAPPVRGEEALGWAMHYLTGMAFAALLVALFGMDWAHSPRLLPALLVGTGTVAAPWLVMQPALGAGIASRKTATPLRNCLRSLANHSLFGAGLYLGAEALVPLFN
ncbi:MAG: DUF2938 domain-containing protein [Ramlibacter sp.]|nr:DUF2938 domain-containing protein [Ramlibacter sp.]